jgi:hypothetical protein
MAAVLADMIEGVVVVNDLQPPESDTVRAALWSEVACLLDPETSMHVRRVA